MYTLLVTIKYKFINIATIVYDRSYKGVLIIHPLRSTCCIAMQAAGTTIVTAEVPVPWDWKVVVRKNAK